MSAIESMNGQHDGQPTEAIANVPVNRSAIIAEAAEYGDYQPPPARGK